MLNDEMATAALSIAEAIDHTLTIEDPEMFDRAASVVLEATREFLWRLLLPNQALVAVVSDGGMA